MENPMLPVSNLPTEPTLPTENENSNFIKPDPVKLKSSVPVESIAEELKPVPEVKKSLDPAALKKRKKMIIIASALGGIFLILLIIIILALRLNSANTSTQKIPVSSPVTITEGQEVKGRVFNFSFTPDASFGAATDKTTQAYEDSKVSCSKEIVTFQNSGVTVGFYTSPDNGQNCFPAGGGDNSISSSIASADGKTFNLITSNNGTDSSDITSLYDLEDNYPSGYFIYIHVSLGFNQTEIANYQNLITKLVNSLTFQPGLKSQSFDTTGYVNFQSGKVFNYSFSYDPSVLGNATVTTKRILHTPTPSYPQAYGSDNVFCNQETVSFSKSDIQVNIYRGGTDGCYPGFGNDAPVTTKTITDVDGQTIDIVYGSGGTLASLSLNDADESIHFGPTTVIIGGKGNDEPTIEQIAKAFSIQPGLISTNFDTTVNN